MTVSKKSVVSFTAILLVASLGLAMLIASPVSAVTMTPASYDQATGKVTVTSTFQTDDKISLNGVELHALCDSGTKVATFSANGVKATGAWVKGNAAKGGTLAPSGVIATSSLAGGETVQAKQTGYGYTNTATVGENKGTEGVSKSAALTAPSTFVISNADAKTLSYTFTLDQALFAGGEDCAFSMRLKVAPLSGDFDSPLSNPFQVKPETVNDLTDSDGDGIPDLVENAAGSDLNARNVKITRLGDQVTIEWEGPTGMVEIYIWRTASPWQLMQKLDGSARSVNLVDTNPNSQYAVTFALGYESALGYVTAPIGTIYTDGPPMIGQPIKATPQEDKTPTTLKTCDDGIKRVECPQDTGTGGSVDDPKVPRGIVAYIVLISLSVVIGVGVILILRVRQ